MTTTEKSVRDEAERVGIAVSTWSPGDGITRYRFGTEGYDGADGDYTALGSTQAMVYLRGYESGNTQEWQCPECDYSVLWPYEILADKGNPVCPDCDIDMVLVEKG